MMPSGIALSAQGDTLPTWAAWAHHSVQRQASIFKIPCMHGIASSSSCPHIKACSASSYFRDPTRQCCCRNACMWQCSPLGRSCLADHAPSQDTTSSRQTQRWAGRPRSDPPWLESCVASTRTRFIPWALHTGLSELLEALLHSSNIVQELLKSPSACRATTSSEQRLGQAKPTSRWG